MDRDWFSGFHYPPFEQWRPDKEPSSCFVVDYDTLLELNAKAAEEMRAKEEEEDEQLVQYAQLGLI